MLRQNRRGYHYLAFDGEHLRLEDLKVRARQLDHKNRYLYRDNIPAYPRPEFHVAHLKHETNKAGLKGIRRNGGFKVPRKRQLAKANLLWWSLTVTPNEISSAERRLLEETQQQIQQQESFLEKFLTSPAFDGTSRLGSFRFTFTVEELLKAYSEQFCSGAKPIMRIYETDLFKVQGVMYVVLVHNSKAQRRYSGYPPLTDHPDAVCSYRDGHFIWRAQAMSRKHRYQLIQRDDDRQMEAVDADRPHQLYVWDRVAIALHVDKKEQVLCFPPDRLRENLMFCKKGKPSMIPAREFQTYLAANAIVKKLWPDCSYPLKR